MTKKIVSLLIALILTVSCITCIAGFSASAEDGKFSVTAQSNFFPQRTEYFDASTETLTVSFYVKSDQMMNNSQWNLYFDETALAYDHTDGVNETAVYYEGEHLYDEYNIAPASKEYGAIINTQKTDVGEIHGNNSNANPVYKLKRADGEKIGFVTVTFKVLDPTKETVVYLELVELLTDKGQIFKFSSQQVDDSLMTFETQSSVYSGYYDPDYVNDAPQPTTAEPTTAEPTTAEPTTVEPTTAPVEPTTEPAPVDHTYTVAGSSAAIFGTTWDAANTANDMTKGGDGVYSIVYTDVQPEDAIQLKVVEDHSWDHAWGDKETGDNYTFNVVEACDVTVTFDPATETVNVTGEGVTQDIGIKAYSVIAVGNGEDTYLNGVNWDPSDTANAMTEVATDVWEMTMEDIYAFDNYNIKFAVNSIDDQGNPTSNPWAHNFGSEVEQLYPTGEELDAVYNGKNCIFEVEEDGSTVKLQLDLRNFDFKTKSGAKMTITVTAPQPAVKIGDINGDGSVDILDATIAQKSAAGKTQLTPEQDYVGDVNNDGICDILDATMIQKYAAGKITEFPKKA